MKACDLRKKGDQELLLFLASSRKEAYRLRFLSSEKSLKNTSLISKNSRLIARVCTVLSERKAVGGSK